jgi:pSer/pThr/pTyr-binding forkhead associated (FHA) protein
MLFLAPHPPVQLHPSDTVVVGRSHACDLTLASADASRRHAEIVAAGEGFAVRDLGSTNGTFVNGERIEEHALRPGDRIQIGASTITFCQVGVGLEIPVQRGEEKTLLIERPVPSEAFHGSLAEIPPYAVLQILEIGRKTGVLQVDSELGLGRLWLRDGNPVHAETKQVDSELGLGRLWLRDGNPVHAETKDQLGFDAALAIVQATSGRFAFEPQTSSPDPTITASVTELLLEASRLEDEGLA